MLNTKLRSYSRRGLQYHPVFQGSGQQFARGVAAEPDKALHLSKGDAPVPLTMQIRRAENTVMYGPKYYINIRVIYTELLANERSWINYWY